ncbi:MAG: glutamine-hydrolyzing carbamoyl-phosphate synthase small subunit [Candidatus Marinimicrobia bacterium]|nr:glutamine-hydrolyzing carbamoyl-phosphate synthase small subunit [Candidatus Neomarinimicrobiota bacterium]
MERKILTKTLNNRCRMKLKLENGMTFQGKSFGSTRDIAGEVVFNTGMVGYPETMTDPSYYGQILVLTYPLIGNYGVPEFNPQPWELLRYFESSGIKISGLIVSEYSEHYSHWNAQQSLAEWLKKENVPAITGIDTRYLTQILREKGTMLGKIYCEDEPETYDPNQFNLPAKISVDEEVVYGRGKYRIAMLDCGCKNSIISNFTEREVEVLRLPWNAEVKDKDFDALFISNGPGDPKMCKETIETTRWAIEHDIPTLGICLGHQIIALAVDADTYKLKYGHRSQNQPVIDPRTKKCIITSQNHGFAVKRDTLPEGWEEWFVNLNDETNEGIRHDSGKFLSTQFHPEAGPGPSDAQFIFDKFVEVITNN